jgi:hypothetical protein
VDEWSRQAAEVRSYLLDSHGGREGVKSYSQPVVRRRRRDPEKPDLPIFLEGPAAKAQKRQAERYAGPGAAVEIESLSEHTFEVVSPHADHAAWMIMIADALGTRSEATSRVFLNLLTMLCQQHRTPTGEMDEHGNTAAVYLPDEVELNMLLQMVGGIRPRNEMEAALAAQMVAVFLLQIKASSAALKGWSLDERTAAIAGKLARTYAMQMDTLNRMRGKARSTKQKIVVTHEKHIHHHQHVHMEGAAAEFGGQPHEPEERRTARNCSGAPLPRSDASGIVVPMPCKQGKEPMPSARRRRGIGSAKG